MVKAGLAKWENDKHSVNALLLPCICSLLVPIALSLLVEESKESERVQVGGSWKDTVCI